MSLPHCVTALVVALVVLGSSSAQDNAVWQANKKDFRIISANPLYGDQNFWVLIAERIPDRNRAARKIVAGYEARTNAEIPRIYRRLNRLLYRTEAKVNRVYNDAERQLDETVRKAALREPAASSDAVTQLQYDTIPASDNASNQAVYEAEQEINTIFRRTQKEVKQIILQAERDVNEAIPKSGPVLTDEVRSIIALAEQQVDQLLVRSGKAINDQIAESSRVLETNIGKVAKDASNLLPAKVSKKLADDMIQANNKKNAVIAKGQREVLAEVKTSTDKLKKIVPAIEAELKAGV